MSDTWQNILGVLGIIGTLVGSYVVAKIGGRVSVHATDTSAALTEEANAVAGFHQLVTDLQGDMQRLRADHETLRKAHDLLGSHVRKLEDERVRDKSLIRHLVNYVRVLTTALRAAHLEIPEAPAGIDLEGGPLAT